MKSANSSLEPPMFVVFPTFCEHTHTHKYIDRQTDTQYDYHTILRERVTINLLYTEHSQTDMG